jgi:hypothetical protein
VPALGLFCVRAGVRAGDDRASRGGGAMGSGVQSGGDSGIFSLLRVSRRARRLGRSGGELGVIMGADDGTEADVGVVVPGDGRGGFGFEVYVEEVGSTIEYRKCLCILRQQGEDGSSPGVEGGRELQDEIGVLGERGEGGGCDVEWEILGWKHGVAQLGTQQETSMQDHETLAMVTEKPVSCLESNSRSFWGAMKR